MNNKGFNWFFPIVIVVILLFFAQNFFGGDKGKSISEDEFFQMMQAGKVEDILMYKDTENVDVFLNKTAKAATVKKEDTLPNPLSGLGVSDKAPDYHFEYGDKQLFLEHFNAIKAENPNITTTKDYGIGNNPLTELLFSALFWIGIMALFYFVLFRKMGGSSGPGGQIFSIGKSRAKLFDEKDKVQVTFKDVAGLEGAKEEVQEVVDFLKNSEKYTKLGGKIPKGVLLVS